MSDAVAKKEEPLRTLVGCDLCQRGFPVREMTTADGQVFWCQECLSKVINEDLSVDTPQSE